MKATLNAFLPEHNGRRFEYAQSNNNVEDMFDCLAFSSIKEIQGWTPMGTVEMEWTSPDSEEILNLRVTALKQQATQVMAEAQMRVDQIEDQIQNLLRLEAPK